MLTAIIGAEVFDPRPLGRRDLILAGDRILRIGRVDPSAVRAVDESATILDASGCLMMPGLVDPHQHIAGAGGEQGFASRMPEVSVEAIIAAGITTVVGCLGTDTSGRHLGGLLAKARQLEEQGITAYIYTGGFPVPPPTFSGNVVDDLVWIDRVIGVGEIAIADIRSFQPSAPELARLVSSALTGGLISGKAGVTHFHVGDSPLGLALLRQLIEDYDTPADHLYPTHVSRSPRLMDEAIELAQRGAFVDIDAIDQSVGSWIRYYEAMAARRTV